MDRLMTFSEEVAWMLCSPCHKAETARLQAELAAGRRLAANLGIPYVVLYPPGEQGPTRGESYATAIVNRPRPAGDSQEGGE